MQSSEGSSFVYLDVTNTFSFFDDDDDEKKKKKKKKFLENRVSENTSSQTTFRY